MSRWPDKTLAERFWEKVDVRGEDECWEWKASKIKNGYGRIGVGGKLKLAHRVSWEMANGAIPDNNNYHGTCILHKCDNPSCVNPNHLFTGTQKDNINDAVNKGRAERIKSKGEANISAKLTYKNARQIREVYNMGVASYRVLAIMYGVTRSTIAKIVTNKTWVEAV